MLYTNEAGPVLASDDKDQTTEGCITDLILECYKGKSILIGLGGIERPANNWISTYKSQRRSGSYVETDSQRYVFKSPHPQHLDRNHEPIGDNSHLKREKSSNREKKKKKAIQGYSAFMRRVMVIKTYGNHFRAL